MSMLASLPCVYGEKQAIGIEMAMAKNEATARIKINRLLEDAGWRFEDDVVGPANIVLEQNVKLRMEDLEEFGVDLEKAPRGFVDFLLLDKNGKPLIVLEAKSERLNPLVGKEQARKYARSKNARFVILSNGNSHHLWDVERGNPSHISRFPRPEEITDHYRFQPDADRIVNEKVNLDYIALTQKSDYEQSAGWQIETERSTFVEKHNLHFLRSYQLQAVKRIQEEIGGGGDRFLLEMATGTGKTLAAAAIIKLFLRTGNSKRVLFLVDRIELENQAYRAFDTYLKNDFISVIFKEQRNDWRSADIVISTVQSLLFNNKYEKLFSPADFDLVVSDEAHRSIGGNSRAVFEYFIGYKLGLTATPKDYLKQSINRNTHRDPREVERRMMLDTYRTFGCESGEPTFRYSLINGVNDGILVNPYVIDARTDITAQLLSDEGYVVKIDDDDDEVALEEAYSGQDFEKRFFAESTNRAFCRALLEHGERDPITKEFGKTIVFTVSQNHAAKITQILNEMADQLWPNIYQSDFAMQVTSHVADAQRMAINFANNNLGGYSKFNQSYRTSKSRICVTVGMMTTGYDAPDILNLALMRPVHSPSEFIQIKGRGTRRHNFSRQLNSPNADNDANEAEKTCFRLFDFFAICEYFEEKFNYDDEIALPVGRSEVSLTATGSGTPLTTYGGTYEFDGPDKAIIHDQHLVGPEGMKVDREMFRQFEDFVRKDQKLRNFVEDGNWPAAIHRLTRELLQSSENPYDLKRIRRAIHLDRTVSVQEIIEKALGLIPDFKSVDELIEDEFRRFLTDQRPEECDCIPEMRYFFEAYIRNSDVRAQIDASDFAALSVNPAFTMQDLKGVPEQWRKRIPEYIRDYVSLNPFV